ncbi:MAG TPA: DNA translocase FtsK, partial [Gemmatimonadaceae bacterium]|nr:DNA translocase FtsK [Gemmatimonadaceae bacterium]
MSHDLKRELAGIALIALALFIGGALALQQLPLDGGCSAARGIFGPVGGCLKSGLLFVFGAPAATILAFIPLVHGLRLLGRMQGETDRRWLLFLAGLVVVLPIVVGLATGTERRSDGPAGMWGGFVAFYLRQAFGTGGAWLAVFAMASALTAWTLRWNPLTARVALPRVASGETPPEALAMEPPPEEMPAIDDGRRETSEAKRRAKRADGGARREGVEGGAGSDGEGSGADAAKKKPGKGKAEPPAVAHDAPAAPAPVVAPEADALEDRLPSPELLTPPPPGNVDVGRKEIEAMGVKLMEALRTFKVEGRLSGQTVGPVVTQFEVEPASGVKVRQFANLANDLALAMRAPSIRVVAPIPGRGAVGVEVPNPVPQIVAFRELIEAKEFQQARMALPIALGKDLEGKVVVADLAKMPHLLIAGATGSGKSVCVNTIITSLVYRHKADTLRFLMV